MKFLPIAMVLAATILSSAIVAAPKALYDHKVNQCVMTNIQPTVFNDFDPMSVDEAKYFCINVQGDI
ncbi:TMhelix containing protein [Vibrio phage 1.253.O._10N.286.45.B12]|nr:TMhelix containing protein [Vibrio phage 1.235.O._10N.261.52.B2]AUR98581.1 TMhelix containing protein [Vibrio phage 1.253.O._10N.286.45.B12]